MSRRLHGAVSQSREHLLTERSGNMYHDGYHTSSGHDVSLNDIPCPPDSREREEVARFGSPAPRTGGWACSPVNGLESINDSSHSYPAQLHKTGSVRRELTFDFDQPPLPSRAIGLSLLEVYFARIYNASLLFYKPFLFRDYLDEKLPDVLLKSIFALSTLYVPSSSLLFMIPG